MTGRSLESIFYSAATLGPSYREVGRSASHRDYTIGDSDARREASLNAAQLGVCFGLASRKANEKRARLGL